MNKSDIYKIIKEEIASILNENTPKYSPGDTFMYMGTKHIVISDDRFIVTAKLPSGNIKKLNHNQIQGGSYKSNINENLRDIPPTQLEPGTYLISYTTENRSSFDKISVEIDPSTIPSDISAHWFWISTVREYDPQFRRGDSIRYVEKI